MANWLFTLWLGHLHTKFAHTGALEALLLFLTVANIPISQLKLNFSVNLSENPSNKNKPPPSPGQIKFIVQST
jgi:hypothetical protein